MATYSNQKIRTRKLIRILKIATEISDANTQNDFRIFNQIILNNKSEQADDEFGAFKTWLTSSAPKGTIAVNTCLRQVPMM